MIRNGMRTKEIAERRGVSEATINRHREKIRRKLKLTNQDVNLATFLQSSMWEGKKTILYLHDIVEETLRLTYLPDKPQFLWQLPRRQLV